MSPLASYRRLFALSGLGFVVVAFLGRLPLAMSQLGTLLLVAGSTGSYGAGGVSAGALAVANAVGAPVAGSLADRFGQRRVVLAQSLGSAAALVALVTLALHGVDWPLQAVGAAVAGLLMPQVGPLARVRWRPMMRGMADHRRLVDLAFSYEGSADEASFVLGPALVGLVATVLAPAPALLTAAVLLAVFGTLFAVHPSALLTRRSGRGATTGAGRLFTGAFVALCFAQLSVGMIFGSVQTGTSVLATSAGVPGLTGLLHALLGVGSVVAGLCMAMVPDRIAYETRWRAFALGQALLALPLLLVQGLGSLSATLLVLGFSIAPYMITVFTLGERITPPGRTGAAMTALAATTGTGYALGSSIAGRLADWGGHTPAFAVTVTAGIFATLLAGSAAGRVQSARLRRAPAAPAPREPELALTPR
ncbi:MAG TPA: MFS transporter [Segeticoccus sp.]|uniref:MFS transporter n=1 Tax=Segeticoccus sp. TaxID=2706531 RepID=UPI002D8100CC|nr:MFS transporter [Segeticoccus sp.]HET8601781.1 MFS transporter [Segeticoccus sp.]